MENISKNVIASISISGEMTLNLHSLNNEGGEGNQIMTRQLTILDKDGKESIVTGISGDMFKHIHASHLVNFCVENKLPLCQGCTLIDPNRIGIDSSFISMLKGIDPDLFEDTDKKRFFEIVDEMSKLDEKSKDYKSKQKERQEIEKKYFLQKITDESDRDKYVKYNELINAKIEKEDKEKKKEQEEAKKQKKEIEKKYNLTFSDEDKINKLLEACVIDDVHGVLVTAGNNNLPRKSVIEFAWTVGIPDKNGTETYLHTKVVADAGVKGSATGSNEGQNIFHRPANYGTYAFICNIDVYRIGLNDISRRYSISEEERIKRYKAILQSLLATILNPKGAMTSSQKPHITDFKGVVAVTHKLMPAPIVSAINPDYEAEIKTIKKSLNEISADTVDVYPFDGLGKFSEVIKELYSAEPYTLA